MNQGHFLDNFRPLDIDLVAIVRLGFLSHKVFNRIRNCVVLERSISHDTDPLPGTRRKIVDIGYD